MSKFLFLGSVSVEVVVFGVALCRSYVFVGRQFVPKLLFWGAVGVKALGG